MQGLLLVDKPAGWTSFDVVAYVRKLARQAALVESYQVYKVQREESGQPAETLDFTNFQLATRIPKVKVGHTGTLDPFATGLLVLLIGKEYTKRAGELSKLDKTYEVTMKLGETSTTGDPEGNIAPYIPAKPLSSRATAGRSLRSGRDDKAASDTAPTPEALQAAVERFRGTIEQVPPAYSAIKINGQRAYKLARAGKEVIIEPRTVTINSLDIVDYTYPEVKLVADVSSGTYIRTLVEDIGAVLGTGAYSTALRRTRVGPYDVGDAISTQALDKGLALGLQSLANEA